MVNRQIAARGIRDRRVLSAMRTIPREPFIPEDRRHHAYEDHPLAIGHGQTISQPYIVALMLQALHLKGDERVLDIGTGSGYVTALLTALSREVYTVERIPELARAARTCLEELGCPHVHFRTGDGTLGWPEQAPFHAIIVGAAAPVVPQPLCDQLTDRGRLVIPVGDAYGQQLLLVTRKGDRFSERRLCPCVFVKLIGEKGWQSPAP